MKTFSPFHYLCRPAGNCWRVLLILCVAAISSVRAQTTVFHDTFTGGTSGTSTINSNPTSPAAPTVSKTAYQQLSAKTFNPNPPTITSGSMRYGSVSTSSGFSSVEALFTQYPVILTNINDYIEMTVVFSGTNLMNAANANLFFGLHNAGQVQPIPGGMNATIGTGTAGYAQNWQGYVSSIVYSGGTHSIKTRSAQTASAANNQDVLYNYSGGVNIGLATTPVVAAFTNGQQYTEVLRITKTGASALTILSTMYQGADTSGTQIFTETITSSSILTDTYDALGIGYRPVGSVATIMNVNSIKVVTTASTTIVPVITSQPSPSSQTVSVGSPVSYSVTATGGGAALSYQWQKSIDGGSNYTDIPTATSTTYSIPVASLTDSAMYRVLVSDVAGQTASDAVTLTVASGPFAPQITSQPSPSSATVVTGTNVSFTAQVSGNPQPTVQWQKSTDGGSNYSNVGTPQATSPSTHAITNVQLSDAGLYRVVATNTSGTATSNAASLTVQKGVTIISQPIGSVVSSGSTYVLSVTVNADATPAPTYLWQKTLDGVSFTTIQSGTQAGLSVTGSNSTSGFYRAIISNAVNSGTSSLVYVGVASTALSTGTFAPASGATGINPDAPLAITFNQPASVGIVGKIRVYDAANPGTPVDTIDMSTAHLLTMTSGTTVLASGRFMQKTIGNLIYDYLPVIVSGNTVSITLHSSTALTYGKTYYVNIDPGVLLDSTGATFSGINNNTGWTLSTKGSGPSANAASLIVAADGSGDFNTVQGAIDFIPYSPANTIARTITVKNGTYTELVHVRSGQNLISLKGQSQSGTLIQYLNNSVILGDLPQQFTLNARAVFSSDANDFTLQSLSIKNLTPNGGSQAEAVAFNGQRVILNHVSLFSYQDTYLASGTQFLYNCYIEGDVDFLWGGGASFFKNCTLHMARQAGGFYAQVRNPATNHGFVFLDCAFTTVPAATNGHYLNRIDPAGFPYCEMVLLNSTIASNALNNTVAVSGNDYNVAWWKMMSANASTAAPNVRLWDYNTRDQNGNPMDISPRAAYTRKLTSPADDTDINNYSNVSWVLGGWSPATAPSIETQPASNTVNPGDSVTFTAVATGFPSVTYQWKKNGNSISGATSASYNIPSASGSDWATYTVTVTNSSGSVTSSAATLTFTDPEDNYVSSYGLDPATTGAPSADPDEDGIANKLEFFLGGNPTIANSSILPVISYKLPENGGPALVFAFKRSKSASGVSYTVEYTDGLTGPWTTAVHGANGITIVTSPVDANTDVITVTIPSANAKLFAKLHL